MKAEDEILTLSEVAVLLKISKHSVYKIWHEWRDRGVRVLKLRPNSVPRFFKSDILKMMQMPK